MGQSHIHIYLNHTWWIFFFFLKAENKFIPKGSINKKFILIIHFGIILVGQIFPLNKFSYWQPPWSLIVMLTFLNTSLIIMLWAGRSHLQNHWFQGESNIISQKNSTFDLRRVPNHFTEAAQFRLSGHITHQSVKMVIGKNYCTVE